MTTEILAPVGSYEGLLAAVRCGANAVYLGSENFNARRNAANFGGDTLSSAIQYAHSHGVKVYITLNTLINDKEIPAFKNELKRICSLGADALILQDLGALNIVKECCLSIPIHASTQMSIHTLSGAKYMQSLGFRRVVLSRELSAAEIKEIRDNTDIEIEYFVHGALCMCVSGQCYMSAFFGSRSGNRGLCAQPCRLNFKAPGSTGYDLSLKDNCLLDFTQDLIKAGVNSFKIEGRMKRPEYVAAAVSAYKKSVDGINTSDDKITLQNIFSRNGFTNGYFVGKRGKNMFGHRTKEDVISADSELLKEQRRKYDKETPLIPFDAEIIVKENSPVTLTVKSEGETVTTFSRDLPQPAVNKPLDAQSVKEKIAKSGNTQFYLNKFKADIDDGLNVPVKVINGLRRTALEGLNSSLKIPKKFEFSDKNIILNGHKVSKSPLLYTRFSDINTVNREILTLCDAVIINISSDIDKVRSLLKSGVRIIAELPRAYFSREKTLEQLISDFQSAGINEFFAGNLGQIPILKNKRAKILGGPGLNLFNSYAFNYAHQLGLCESLVSVENTAAQINSLVSPIPTGAIVYGKIPLMISRNCPLKNGRKCSECDEHGFITDRMGEKFDIRCNFGCSEIFNPHPIYMCDKADEIHTDFHMLFFTTETREEAVDIIRAYKSRQKPAEKLKFTRGLYYKGVK